MTSSRTVIAATALATTIGLSACSGGSSSSHDSVTKKSPSSSAKSASSSSPMSSSPSPTAKPSASELISTMQTNLKKAKSLHLHATGYDFNGELLHNGPQSILLDINGSPTGDPTETLIKSGDAMMQIRSIAEAHYLKGNSAFWKSTLAQSSQSSSSDATQKIQRYSDKWIKTPEGMAGFSELSIQKLLQPLLGSEPASQLTEANTTVTPVDLHGTPAWKMTDKTGLDQLWFSQKTGDLLELKYGAKPTSELPLNDFTFSDVNKDFHITAPTDAITP